MTYCNCRDCRAVFVECEECGGLGDIPKSEDFFGRPKPCPNCNGKGGWYADPEHLKKGDTTASNHTGTGGGTE